MTELKENGPIVVSFEPDYNFMMYKSGIYHSIDEKTWISKRMPKPEWEKVDHSVLLVGWGEDDQTNEKFWIIQNTWGPNWGEEGFFRMKRGVDEFGIESICEAAEPYILDRNTKKQISKKDLEEENNKNYNGNINISSPSSSNFNIYSNFDSSKLINNENLNSFDQPNSLINQLNNLDSAMKDNINININSENDFNSSDESQNSLFDTLY